MQVRLFGQEGLPEKVTFSKNLKEVTDFWRATFQMEKQEEQRPWGRSVERITRPLFLDLSEQVWDVVRGTWETRWGLVSLCSGFGLYSAGAGML